MAEIWDAALLERVRHLHRVARRLSDGLAAGHNRARRSDQGVEYAESREYVPGMDLRHVDWKALARRDRLVVKRQVADREFASVVVLDLSADMSTGGSDGGLPDLDESKAGRAIAVVATMLAFLHRHGEPVGLTFVAGEGFEHRVVPPRAGRRHLQLLMRQLALARPAGSARLGEALRELGARSRRACWLAVVSDGMEEPSAWIPALGAISARGSDVRMVHIYDQAEWAMADADGALLYSPEGGPTTSVEYRDVRHTFAQAADAYVQEVRAGLMSRGVRHVLSDVSGSLEKVLRGAIA